MEDILIWVNKYDNLITASLTFAIAFSAMVSAVITFYLAIDNRILRKAGTEPDLIAYILPDSRYINLINFHITNVGKGTATEISFDVVGDHKLLSKSGLELSLIKRPPISALPPGDSITTFFGMAHILLSEPKLEPFKVILNYHNGVSKSFEKMFSLDIGQFEELSRVGKNAEDDIAESIKKIEGHMGKLISVAGKIRVIADSPEGWRQEAQREREEMEKLRKNKSNKNKGK